MSKKLKIHDGDTLGKTFEVKLEYPKPKVTIMSNSIWKMPDERPRNTDRLVVRYLNNDTYYNIYVDEVYNWSHIKEWCYLADLIAQADKAERLLEIAERQNDILQDHFATLGYSIGKEVMDMSEEIEQLIEDE